MRVLVTGGAGFIGSVVVEKLLSAGHYVVAFDNLKYGHRAAVAPDATFVAGDIHDGALLRQTMQQHGIDAVAHLAAEAYIDESVRNPALFYHANTVGGCTLLDAMLDCGVKRLVFSSTAAVYGEPREVPVKEDAILDPCNSYGDSKLAFEKALRWYQSAYGINYITFRYFNACGATPRCGEYRKKETHLIPICFGAALGQRASLTMYGSDYPTKDGTCVRDYVHVADIAQAHVLGLEQVDTLKTGIFNLGHGAGYTNREIVSAVKKVTGIDFAVVDGDRRPGDPAVLVASSDRAKQVLGWKPEFTELDRIIETAWQWRKTHPNGYGEATP